MALQIKEVVQYALVLAQGQLNPPGSPGGWPCGNRVMQTEGGGVTTYSQPNPTTSSTPPTAMSIAIRTGQGLFVGWHGMALPRTSNNKQHPPKHPWGLWGGALHNTGQAAGTYSGWHRARLAGFCCCWDNCCCTHSWPTPLPPLVALFPPGPCHLGRNIWMCGASVSRRTSTLVGLPAR